MKLTFTEDRVLPMLFVEGASATGSIMIAKDYSHLELPLMAQFYARELELRKQRAYLKAKRKKQAYKKMLKKNKKRGHKATGSYVLSLKK